MRRAENFPKFQLFQYSARFLVRQGHSSETLKAKRYENEVLKLPLLLILVFGSLVSS